MHTSRAIKCTTVGCNFNLKHLHTSGSCAQRTAISAPLRSGISVPNSHSRIPSSSFKRSSFQAFKFQTFKRSRSTLSRFYISVSAISSKLVLNLWLFVYLHPCKTTSLRRHSEWHSAEHKIYIIFVRVLHSQRVVTLPTSTEAIAWSMSSRCLARLVLFRSAQANNEGKQSFPTTSLRDLPIPFFQDSCKLLDRVKLKLRQLVSFHLLNFFPLAVELRNSWRSVRRINLSMKVCVVVHEKGVCCTHSLYIRV